MNFIDYLYDVITKYDLNHWQFLISLLTLIILGIYAWDTKKIAKETKNTRLDPHLPILECTYIRLLNEELNIDLKNIGFNYFRIKSLKINNQKYDFETSTSTDLDGSNERFNISIEIKKNNNPIKNGEENTFEINYLDIHNRKIKSLIKAKMTDKLLPNHCLGDGTTNYSRAETKHTIIKYEKE